jgi:hypothetical protein
MADQENNCPDNVVTIDFSRKNSKKSAAKHNQEKFSLFSTWISSGLVSLIMDARHKEVLVPKEFKDNGELRLNFSHLFHLPDFNFNNTSVWATLSFDSGDFFCQVPWTAVFAMQSPNLHQGAVWPEDFPSDCDPRSILGMAEELAEAAEPIDTHQGSVIAVDFGSPKDMGPQ